MARTYALALFALTTLALPAQTFTTLLRFNQTDGQYPWGGLVQGIYGELYGTTQYGGANHQGSVYKITSTGVLTEVYSFCAQTNCLDGIGSYATLVQDAHGDLYGTTAAGGAGGEGTIFKITPANALTTLHSFCTIRGCTDGAAPMAGLVRGASGELYGTTYGDGANRPGTVFKMTHSGLTTLHTFCTQSGCPDGSGPMAALVQGADGALYGTTAYGGTSGGPYGGTVFRITPSGAFTTLYSFCAQTNCTDGAEPRGSLVQAGNGDFYGTTYYGGANATNGSPGTGTVFKLSPAGVLTTLHTFCSVPMCTDGEFPQAGLILASDGNFYGTTSFGGPNIRGGAVFKITTGGTLTSLHNFCLPRGCPDGQSPEAALAQATDGTLYGTTYYGGSYECGSGCGTIFSIASGLPAFIKPQPAIGKIGASIQILGINLAFTSGVTFNGTAALYQEITDSLLNTIVPAGATSGAVQVMTPAGTQASSVPFQVLP